MAVWYLRDGTYFLVGGQPQRPDALKTWASLEHAGRLLQLHAEPSPAALLAAIYEIASARLAALPADADSGLIRDLRRIVAATKNTR